MRLGGCRHAYCGAGSSYLYQPRESKTFQIPSAIQTGKKYGMQSLDDAILAELKTKKISPEDAYDKGIVKDRFTSFLKKPPEFI